jgi:hypothetical protein
MEKLIKTDIPNLVRDMDSRELNSVVDEIDQIKQDMADIKSMLQQIIGNRS